MIKEATAKIVDGSSLAALEAEEVMAEIMEGATSPAQVGGFLTALRMKGETWEEVAGCAMAMKKKAVCITPRKKPLIDTCGTGGDGLNTFNISTLAAIVLASAGLHVAKHGNRSISSKCGSADILEALGIRVDLQPESVKSLIDEAGFGFLFAPTFHPAMKYAMGPRKELGFRTIFNILGPLTNPAGAEQQLVGAFRRDLVDLIAKALKTLGVSDAMIVHGLDGMDEISVTGPTYAVRLNRGELSYLTLTPEDFGLPKYDKADLVGGDLHRNAAIAKDILSDKGKPACRDAVLANVSAALLIAGRTVSLKDGVAFAKDLIRSGRAIEKLNELVEISNKYKPLGVN